MYVPSVGLIVPLPEEFTYVTSALDILGDVVTGERAYHRFRIPGTTRTGVLSVVHDMGQANAALAASELVHSFDVRLLAVLGTAAVLDDGIPLGDVVIGSEIVDYLLGAKSTEDPADPTAIDWRSAGTTWKPSARLRRWLQDYPLRTAGRERVAEWSTGARAASRLAEEPPAPAYHVAPIATGDVVVGSRAFRERILRHHRKVAAVEMEAGGAALAAYQKDDVDLMVIRGVSDRALPDKSATDATLDRDGRPNAWRRHAVANAASLFVTLLSAPDFPWRADRTPHPVATTAALTLPTGLLAGVLLETARHSGDTTPDPLELPAAPDPLPADPLPADTATHDDGTTDLDLTL